MYGILQETQADSYIVITNVCLRNSENYVCHHQRVENISEICWPNTEVCSPPNHVSFAEVCVRCGLQSQGITSSSTQQYLQVRQQWLLGPHSSQAIQ